VTFLILVFVNATIGLRVTPEQEVDGLDLSQHREQIG
jgi:ammonia channel protein AmtB